MDLIEASRRPTSAKNIKSDYSRRASEPFGNYDRAAEKIARWVIHIYVFKDLVENRVAARMAGARDSAPTAAAFARTLLFYRPITDKTFTRAREKKKKRRKSSRNCHRAFRATVKK